MTARQLLSKKLDITRGVRLLGVAFENVEKKSLPVQQELFDFGEKKRARLEEAIYNLEERNPAIKITKARLLK